MSLKDQLNLLKKVSKDVTGFSNELNDEFGGSLGLDDHRIVANTNLIKLIGIVVELKNEPLRDETMYYLKRAMEGLVHILTGPNKNISTSSDIYWNGYARGTYSLISDDIKSAIVSISIISM